MKAPVRPHITSQQLRERSVRDIRWDPEIQGAISCFKTAPSFLQSSSHYQSMFCKENYNKDLEAQNI